LNGCFELFHSSNINYRSVELLVLPPVKFIFAGKFFPGLPLPFIKTLTMTKITDEYMQSMLGKIKPYCMVILKPGMNTTMENAKEIIWEHGRRNFALRKEGKISLVCPVSKEADISGMYIFNTTEDEAAYIMKDDPAVVAGIFEYYTYPCMSFPGDKLK